MKVQILIKNYIIGDMEYVKESIMIVLAFSIIAILFLVYMKKILRLIFKLDFKIALKSNTPLFKEKSIELKDKSRIFRNSYYT